MRAVAVSQVWRVGGTADDARPFLDDPAAEVREDVVRALLFMDGTVETVHPLLNDPSERVTNVAAWAFRRYPSETGRKRSLPRYRENGAIRHRVT